MAVYKDNAAGTWRVIYRFTNWKGERKQTQKRGFATKREAQAWEHEAMLKQGAKLDMTFGSFFELYEADKRQRVKESTWESKSHVIRTKILPYFENRRIAEIEAKDVIAWQNELMSYRDENGKPYSADYLRTIHAQLTAIFNHAVNFYGSLFFVIQGILISNIPLVLTNAITTVSSAIVFVIKVQNDRRKKGGPGKGS